MILVYVRWHDGYFERFACTQVRHGTDLLWLELTSMRNRHIPLRSVRWFSVNPPSQEPLDVASAVAAVSGGPSATQSRLEERSEPSPS